MLKALTIFSGNANRELAQAICRYVETPLGRAEVTRFADGEIYVEINENVRGVNCFVVQPTCAPANDNLMELLVMIDALKRASAGSIIACIPYFGYARQDRKTKPRTPISARLVADLLTAAGVDRVLSIDLHAGQIQGFFNIPVDHLYGMPVLLEPLKQRIAIENAVIVSVMSSSSMGEATMRSTAGSDSTPCDATANTVRAPLSLMAWAAAHTVPAVSIMSSTMTASLPLTSPMMLTTSETFGAGLRLSMIARLVPRRFE